FYSSLMNLIKPGSVKTIHTRNMPFMHMENIGFFNEQMRNYGVDPNYLFVTVDLFEGQNIPQVLIGLRNLADIVSRVNVIVTKQSDSSTLGVKAIITSQTCKRELQSPSLIKKIPISMVRVSA
ncbi:unnamed protein product, partial [Owenia fusiformis]